MNSADLGPSVLRKIERRIVPFCILLFVVSFIDRINAGFAALDMNKALGIGPEAFGIGVGLFFIGYFLFEVPSNLILQRVGARIWIGRIVISWGALTALHALIVGPQTFWLMRFLLGLAEAGFAPGILFYFTLWFPARNRGAIMSRYLTASAIAVVVGAPLSTSLFQLSGVFGLSGWQWMFLIEGTAGVLLGIVTIFYLQDRPEDAHWLNEEEKKWLIAELDRGGHALVSGTAGIGIAFKDYRVWILTFMFFCFGISSYGLIFWIPQIVKQISGLTNIGVGFVTALPWIAAIIVMTLVGWSSDRFQERHLHFASSFLASAAGLLGSVTTGNPVLAMICIGVAAAGMWSALGVFWTMPSQLFKGSAAAACLALINSIGNLGGFAGPYFMGWAKQATDGFTTGLMGLALCMVAGALASVVLKYISSGPSQGIAAKIGASSV